jgi:hypothetical protein
MTRSRELGVYLERFLLNIRELGVVVVGKGIQVFGEEWVLGIIATLLSMPCAWSYHVKLSVFRRSTNTSTDMLSACCKIASNS